MAVTIQTVNHVNDVGKMYQGSWTTDSSKGDHTITFDRRVKYIQCVLDSQGTNPNVLIKHVGDTTDTQLITGSTGVITSPTDATGITVTNTGYSSSVLVDSNSQTNSGVNFWFALCE